MLFHRYRDAVIGTNTRILWPHTGDEANLFFGNLRRLIFHSNAGLLGGHISHSAQKITTPVDTLGYFCHEKIALEV